LADLPFRVAAVGTVGGGRVPLGLRAF
jgi:hypothetical protein